MVTILTEPSTNKLYHLQKIAKRFVKLHILKRTVPPYSGHFAVVRSLLEGFNKISQAYNYNPARESQLADHVHVLANIDALKLAIALKKKGRIKRLTAGPNIVISSADSDGIIASKEIDMYFVNSEWTKATYLLDNPALQGRIGIWAAGIDERKWEVTENKKGSVALFYKKRPEHFLYENCKSIARQKGYDIIEISYGNYNFTELKAALRIASYVAYFVEQESQGIALQEIWAANIPTFVWNPEIWMYNGTNYKCCSAPYLTAQTGAFFKDIKAFEELLSQPLDNYSPSEWVRSNMTDSICAADFLKKTKSNEH